MVSLPAASTRTIKPLAVPDRHSGNSTSSRMIIRCTKNSSLPPPRKPQQPSIAEIERVIGAGKFRDQDTSSNPAEGKNLFDSVLSNTIGKTEGSVEKRLRETGEWMGDRSEEASRSSGKKILEVLYLWIVPIWLLCLLVAAGGIKLPFNIPALEDLLM